MSRPYVCSMCERGFRTQNGLDTHACNAKQVRKTPTSRATHAAGKGYNFHVNEPVTEGGIQFTRFAMNPDSTGSQLLVGSHKGQRVTKVIPGRDTNWSAAKSHHEIMTPQNSVYSGYDAAEARRIYNEYKAIATSTKALPGFVSWYVDGNVSKRFPPSK